MRYKIGEDLAIAHNALDKFYSNNDDLFQIDEEQVLFLESAGINPNAMAKFTRLVIGNSHDPIDDPVKVALALKINVGVLPERIQNTIPACAAWFHETPTLLVAERSNSSQYRHVVATEIGGLLVARVGGRNSRQHDRCARSFADALLYPDTAVKELLHAPSRKRYISHSEDFGVPRSVIWRRLLKSSRRSS